MAQPASATAQSPALKSAVTNIVRQLKLPIIDRQLTYTEGRIIRSFLDHANLQPGSTNELFTKLAQAGVLDQFLQTAHPRWGPGVRQWLEEQGVPWSQIHGHYQYDLRDSIDFFAGFLLGMGVSLADLPLMLAKLASITINGKLAEETQKFFDSIEGLVSRNIATVLQEAASKWVQEFDDLIYRLEWFRAGQKLGNTVMNIVVFGHGAAKLLASLPKFVKMLPAAAKQVTAVSKATAAMAIASAQDAIAYLKALGGLLFVVPDLRYSRLLPAILTPGDLRTLLNGGIRVVTKSGFELVYVESTKTAGTVLRSGFLPSDFVSESYVVIRDAVTKQLKARIYNPRSLGYALKDVGDDDLDGFLKVVLDDPNVPPSSLPREDLETLCRRAMKDSAVASSLLNVNVRDLAERFAAAAAKRANPITLGKGAKPSAANFGTLVEGDMKPVIRALEQQYPHLTFYRNQTMGDILGSRVPGGSSLLKKSVAQYVRENQLLAKSIGFEGDNLSKVLAAKGDTILGDLRPDLLIVDNLGHQGLLLDWTSFFPEKGIPIHFNKTMLYHAIVGEVFPNMRLPFGEMYHFGFQK